MLGQVTIEAKSDVTDTAPEKVKSIPAQNLLINSPVAVVVTQFYNIYTIRVWGALVLRLTDCDVHF